MRRVVATAVLPLMLLAVSGFTLVGVARPAAAQSTAPGPCEPGFIGPVLPGTCPPGDAGAPVTPTTDPSCAPGFIGPVLPGTCPPAGAGAPVAATAPRITFDPASIPSECRPLVAGLSPTEMTALATASGGRLLRIRNEVARCEANLVTRPDLSAVPRIAPNVKNPSRSEVRELIKATEGLMQYALLACLVAILVSASMWALGTKGGNDEQAFNGKRGAFAGVLAAFCIGATPTAINFFVGVGSQILR